MRKTLACFAALPILLASACDAPASDDGAAQGAASETSASDAAADAETAAVAPNPLFTGADPDSMTIDGELWIFPTGSATGSWSADRFHAYSSSDLETWTDRGTLIRMDDIDWIDEDGAEFHALWAPGIAEKDGKYYLYYSVGPQNPTPSRIGVAVADRPEGPYTDSGAPLITGGDGFEAIDAMVFTDEPSGKTYLYAGGSAGATLRVWELGPDMISLAREVDVETPKNFTEGAFMSERDGTYYLSYSHGRFNRGNYSVHYATAPSPTGPWTYAGPILTSDQTHQGPGHHSFAEDPQTGEPVIVYHRWDVPAGTEEPFEGERNVAIERLVYRDDGSIAPVVMTDGEGSEVVEAE